MRRFIYPGILYLFISVTFGLLYYFDRYFFLRDDTIRYFLPLAKLQGEIVFFQHQIPFINFYQFLGQPLLPQGQSGVFFLPRYLFFLIAYLFDNYFLIVDLEVYFHLVLSGLGMYLLLRYLSVTRRWAFIAGYFYSFNGFAMEVGRNWLMVFAYTAYLPFLFYLLIRYLKTGKGFFLLTMFRVFIFSVGYTNFFVYIVLFEIIFYLFYERRKNLIIKYLASHFITLVAILPLLFPIISGVLRSERNNGFSQQFVHSLSFSDWVSSFLAQPCQAWVSEPCAVFTFFSALKFVLVFLLLFSLYKFVRYIRTPLFVDTVMTSVRFYALRFLSGSRWYLYLLALVFVSVIVFLNLYILFDLVVLLFFVIAFFVRGTRRIVFITLAFYFLSVALSFGNRSLFSYLFYPFIMYFRWPWKWYLLGQFFLIMFVALLFTYYVRINRFFSVLLFFLLSCLQFVAIIFYTYPFNVVTLPTQFTAIESYSQKVNGRVVGVGTKQLPTNHGVLFVDGLGAYFHVFTFAGYNPLSTKSLKQMVELDEKRPLLFSDSDYAYFANRLEAFSVQTYVVTADKESEFTFLRDSRFRKFFSDDQISLYTDTLAPSLVYFADGTAVPFTIHGNKVDVFLSEQKEDSEIVFGFYKDDEGWVASVDNRRVSFLSDDYSRMRVFVPAGTRRVTLEYRDYAFYWGVGSSAILFLCFLLFVLYTKKAG